MWLIESEKGKYIHVYVHTLYIQCIVLYLKIRALPSVAQWKSTQSREQSVVGSNPEAAHFSLEKRVVSGVVVLC